MNFFAKKSNLMKSGIAVAAVAIALINYSQSNANGKSVSVAKISDANAADNCRSNPSTSCYELTSDGLWHSTTNAENN